MKYRAYAHGIIEHQHLKKNTKPKRDRKNEQIVPIEEEVPGYRKYRLQKNESGNLIDKWKNIEPAENVGQETTLTLKKT